MAGTWLSCGGTRLPAAAIAFVTIVAVSIVIAKLVVPETPSAVLLSNEEASASPLAWKNLG